jgi:nucleotide-binding universal stress UspA family protein
MKVLLAVDDEDFGEAIAEFAMHHAWPAATEFRVANVIPSLLAYTSMSAVPELIHDLREESRKKGAALVRKIALKLRDVLHSSHIEETVVEGHPADEILSMAKEWSADLILVGSHGRRGLNRLIMGSISMAVVSHAPCSVLVVRLAPASCLVEKSHKQQKSKEAEPVRQK